MPDGQPDPTQRTRRYRQRRRRGTRCITVEVTESEIAALVAGDENLGRTEERPGDSASPIQAE
jgi:hypothetical protein